LLRHSFVVVREVWPDLACGVGHLKFSCEREATIWPSATSKAWHRLRLKSPDRRQKKGTTQRPHQTKEKLMGVRRQLLEPEERVEKRAQDRQSHNQGLALARKGHVGVRLRRDSSGLD
jgi:hypothetical protein